MSYPELIRFLTAPNFVIFLLTYSVFLVMMSSQVYGIETSTWFRTVFWPLNSAFIGVLYAIAFWYCEYLARKTKKNYIIFSLGIHTLTVLLAVPLGALVLGWIHGIDAAFSTLALWDFLKAILIASAFEFAVVNWIWPAEVAAWETESNASKTSEPVAPEKLREHFEQDLDAAEGRWPYISYTQG